MSGENSPTNPENTSESESKLKAETVETPHEGGESLVSLNEVIQESQAALEAPAPIKNKGGRPKGSKTKNRTVKSEEAPPAPVEGSQASQAVSLAPVLGLAAGLPFTIAARRTGFEGFKLNAEETAGIGQAMDAVLLKYFPQVSEKAGVELMLCSTVLAVTMAKMIEFEAYKESLREKAKAIENEKVRVVHPPQAESPGLTNGLFKQSPADFISNGF